MMIDALTPWKQVDGLESVTINLYLSSVTRKLLDSESHVRISQLKPYSNICNKRDCNVSVLHDCAKFGNQV